jgi:hypothetical protein
VHAAQSLGELTAELGELRDREGDIGLDAVGRRLVMRRAF